VLIHLTQSNFIPSIVLWQLLYQKVNNLNKFILYLVTRTNLYLRVKFACLILTQKKLVTMIWMEKLKKLRWLISSNYMLWQMRSYQYIRSIQQQKTDYKRFMNYKWVWHHYIHLLTVYWSSDRIHLQFMTVNLS